MVAVQIRGKSGEVFVLERVSDADAALAVAMNWVRLLVEDVQDPIEALELIPTIEIVPAV
jgi:hypothetical protein